jgi:hypothetical protein
VLALLLAIGTILAATLRDGVEQQGLVRNAAGHGNASRRYCEVSVACRWQTVSGMEASKEKEHDDEPVVPFVLS